MASTDQKAKYELGEMFYIGGELFCCTEVITTLLGERYSILGVTISFDTGNYYKFATFADDSYEYAGYINPDENLNYNDNSQGL